MVTFLNESGKYWLEYFGFLTVQNTLFLGILSLILFIFKNASARVKHCIVTIGLAKLLLLPFIPIFIFGNAVTPQIVRNNDLVNSAPTGTVINTNVLSIEALLFIGWIILGVGILLFFLFSILKLRIQLRNSKELKTNEYNVLTNLKIKLFQNDKISMPISCGYFSKKIYVPKIWDKWNSECQNFIIEHEIAHLKRRDNWILILQMMTKAIYFFHPLVWYLNRHLDDFREMACDDYTTSGDKNYAIKYSRYLVEIAETTLQNRSGCFMASALIKQKYELLNRVKYLMEGKIKNISKQKFIMVMAGLLVSSLTLSMYCSKQEPTEATANSEIISNQLSKTPNSVRPNVINYYLPEDDRVVLTIFNNEGKLINKLVDKFQQAGSYTIDWDGVDQNGKKVPSGLYIYKVETVTLQSTVYKKMILRK